MSERLATAPCLLKELLPYTPQSPAFAPALSAGCSHAYATSSQRSQLPQLDEQPTSSTAWTVQATCLKCRCHLFLGVNFAESEQPCPSRDFPLHHLRVEQEPQLNERVQSFLFSCGAPTCRMRLAAEIRPPILASLDIEYLTSAPALQQRAAHTSEQRQSEISASTPVEALVVLRSYVRDAVMSGEVKRIPTQNKRFMLALGDQAVVLLARLGFVFEPAKDATGFAYWRLPSVNQQQGSEMRTMLQDVDDELTVLIQQRPDAERATVKEPIAQPLPAAREMERTLGSLDYPKSPPQTRQARLPRDILDSFSAIGALPDFSDELVIFAYDRNVIWNPPSSPLYFQHLRSIATFRRSEALEMKVLTLQSAGQVAQEDVVAAYQYFDVHPDRETIFNDDQILGKYHAHLSDVGSEERIRAKQHLMTIAMARGSKLLKNAASDRLETYEEALSYLGADQATPDDFILSLMTAKSGEDPSNHSLAQEALKIIADARGSDTLRYQGSRDLGKSSMTLTHAYSLLGISEASKVDDEIISASHGVALSDSPGRAEELNEALGVIADARNSMRLKHYLTDNQDLSNSQMLASAVLWKDLPFEAPRGLKNIGNTCYLNSLLQYLYTIKPLRQLLKDFDQHKQDLSDGTQFAKKVAGMQASKDDVRTAQNFVHELGRLFDDLAQTPQPFAQPDVNLARLTIGEPKLSDPTSPVAGMSRRLTVSSPQPASDFHLLKGDLSVEPTAAVAKADDVEMGEALATSAESSTGKPADKSGLAEVEGGSPNMKAEEIAAGKSSVDTNTDALPDVKRPDQNENEGRVSEDKMLSGPEQSLVSQTEEWARQQDVTDALENVIKQLQWAIKPEAVDSAGDQKDLISRLFWGKEHVMSVKPTGETAEILPFKDLLVRPDDSPSDLMEALDDSEFGKEDHGPQFYKYNVISELPAILHIAISRAKTENGKLVRNTNQLILHPEITMDRYMNDQGTVAKRKESFKSKDALKQLKGLCKSLESTQMGVSISQALESSEQHLQSLRDQAPELGLDLDAQDEHLQDAFQLEALDANERIDAARLKINPLQQELAVQSLSEEKLKYSLQAVFVHRGVSLVAGHWIIYIYDHRTGKWRRYNDEEVSEIAASDVQWEIFQPDEASRGASAYVSYVRNDLRDEIFDVGYRSPAEPTAERPLIDLEEGPAAQTPDQGAFTERPAWDSDRSEMAGIKW